MLTRGLISMLVVVLAPAPPGDGDGVEVSAQSAGYIISGRQAPRPGAVRASSKGPKVTCAYTPWAVDGQKNGGLEFVDPASNPNDRPSNKGAYYLAECSDGYRDVIWIAKKYDPGITPEQLARKAYARIPIRSPKVLTAPPRGKEGLVGLPHWFYLAKGEWVARSNRLRAGLVWARATATPQRMTISPGDGKTITCDGPGTRYAPATPAAQQRSTCSYRYSRPSGSNRVTVSVTWGGTWRGSGGTGGALPPITRSVTFPVRVVEAQALVTKE